MQNFQMRQFLYKKRQREVSELKSTRIIIRHCMEEIGYIKTIREDGKIDITLQKPGYENIDEFKTKILDSLEKNYGLLYLTDASSPEEIKEELQMSKKNFKKAIGGLYKDKKIEILEDKIRLL